MGLIDLITRVDTICKKYEKYDIDKQREANVSGDDAFSRLYSAVESALQTVLQVRLYSPDFVFRFSVCFWFFVIVRFLWKRYDRKRRICRLRRIERKLWRLTQRFEEPKLDCSMGFQNFRGLLSKRSSFNLISIDFFLEFLWDQRDISKSDVLILVYWWEVLIRKD